MIYSILLLPYSGHLELDRLMKGGTGTVKRNPLGSDTKPFFEDISATSPD